MPYRLDKTLCKPGNLQEHKRLLAHTAVTKPPMKAAPNVLSKCSPDTATDTGRDIVKGKRRKQEGHSET
jgi:hypothetical protein